MAVSNAPLPTSGNPGYYFTGGTMPPHSDSYVVREADESIYDRLKNGVYCYVLDSRQMGKSSLMARAAERLRNEHLASVAVIDLSRCGENVTVDQWYSRLAEELGKYLGLEDEIDDYWEEHEGAAPLGTFIDLFGDVILLRKTGPVIVFIDEIDYVRNLSFSADELFAGIRSLYNSRHEDPRFDRLTFCLLGVATPSDLIRSSRTTPYNIGQRIEMKDFSLDQMHALAKGLKRDPETADALVHSILYWTGGHPYLTQVLCDSVAKDPMARTGGDVYRHVDRLYFGTGSAERDDHLVLVRKRLLDSEEVDRAQVLDLYKALWRIHRWPVLGLLDRFSRAGELADDETKPVVNVLRLSGVTRTEHGYLRIRNRIYARVFDREWIEQHTPHQELRRQRRAFLQGTVVAAVVVALVLAVGGLLVLAEKNRILSASRKLAEKAAQDLSTSLSANTVLIGRLNDEKRSLATQGVQLSDALEKQKRLAEEKDSANAERLNLQRRLTDAARKTAEDLQVERDAKEVERKKASDLAISEAASATAAKEQTRIATEQTGLKDQELAKNKVLTASATAQKVAYQADLLRTQQPALLERSLLLSAASLKREQSLVADQSLRSGLELLPRQLRQLQYDAQFKPADRSYFSPDGRFLFLTSRNALVSRWDVARGGDPIKLDRVTADPMMISGDGNYTAHLTRVAGSAWQVSVIDWSVPEKPAVKPLPFQACQSSGAVAFIGNDRIAVSDCSSGLNIMDLKSWETRTVAAQKKPAKDALHFTFALAGSRDGNYLVEVAGLSPFARSRDQQPFTRIKIWNTKSWTVQKQTLTNLVNAQVGFDPSGVAVFLWGQDLTTSGSSSSAPVIDVWDFISENGTRRIAPSRPFNRLAYLPKSHLLMVSGNDDSTVLFDITRRTEVGRVAHTARIVALAASPDGSRFATAGDDGTGRVWNAATRQEVLRIPAPGIVEIAFGPDGASVTTVGRSGVQVWDTKAGSDLFSTAVAGLNQLSMTANGGLVGAAVTGRQTSSLELVQTADDIRSTQRYQTVAKATAFALSPDGSLTATASQSGSVRVLESRSGRILYRWECAAPASEMSFSHSGRYLAVRTHDAREEAIEIWDRETTFHSVVRLAGHSYHTPPDPAFQLRLRSIQISYGYFPNGYSSAYYYTGPLAASLARGGIVAPEVFADLLVPFNAARALRFRKATLVFSPDEKQLLVLGGLVDFDHAGTEFTVWDVRGITTTPRQSLKGRWVQISSRGDSAVVGGAAPDSTEAPTFMQLREAASSQKAVPRSTQFTMWTPDGGSGRLLPIPLSGGQYEEAALSDDGTHLALVDVKGGITVFDTDRRAVTWTHAGAKLPLAISPSGKFVCQILPRRLAVWNTANAASPEAILPIDDQIRGLHFDLGEQHLIVIAGGTALSNSRQLAAQVFETDRFTARPVELEPDFYPDHRLAFSSNGGWFAVVSSAFPGTLPASDPPSQVLWWDRSGNPDGKPFPIPKASAAASHPAKGLLAVAHADDPIVQVEQIGTSTPPVKVSVSLPADKLAFSPSGSFLAAVAGRELTVIAADRTVVLQRDEESTISDVAFSPGDLLAVAAGNKVDFPTLPGHAARQAIPALHNVSHVVFSGSRGLLAFSADDLIEIRSLTGTETHQLPLRGARVRSMQFSPDSRNLAIGLESENSMVWEFSSELVHQLPGDEIAQYVAFHPEGEYLLVRSGRTVRVWRWRDSVEVARVARPTPVSAAAFSGDGTTVVSLAAGVLTRSVWSRNDLVKMTCDRVTRDLTTQEWGQYFPGESQSAVCPEAQVGVLRWLPGATGFVKALSLFGR